MLSWLATARAEVPTTDDFLTPLEQRVLEKLFIPKRRSDWRHGRWTAKRALDAAWRCRHAGIPPRWCILAAEDGAPEAFDEGDRPAKLQISLSHSGGLAVCALASRETRWLGCDLERVEPRTDDLIEQFFTESEQRRVRAAGEGDRPLVACLIWSAKESALKAVRLGLREDTRSVEVEWSALPSAAEWRPFVVTRGQAPSKLCGQFRVLHDAGASWVMTLVAEPPVGEPMDLRETGGYCGSGRSVIPCRHGDHDAQD